eukprot:scaffold44537_cov175-Skeletonema_marinoi.AAC.1
MSLCLPVLMNSPSTTSCQKRILRHLRCLRCPSAHACGANHRKEASSDEPQMKALSGELLCFGWAASLCPFDALLQCENASVVICCCWRVGSNLWYPWGLMRRTGKIDSSCWLLVWNYFICRCCVSRSENHQSAIYPDVCVLPSITLFSCITKSLAVVTPQSQIIGCGDTMVMLNDCKI